MWYSFLMFIVCIPLSPARFQASSFPNGVGSSGRSLGYVDGQVALPGAAAKPPGDAKAASKASVLAGAVASGRPVASLPGRRWWDFGGGGGGRGSQRECCGGSWGSARA